MLSAPVRFQLEAPVPRWSYLTTRYPAADRVRRIAGGQNSEPAPSAMLSNRTPFSAPTGGRDSYQIRTSPDWAYPDLPVTTPVTGPRGYGQSSSGCREADGAPAKPAPRARQVPPSPVPAPPLPHPLNVMTTGSRSEMRSNWRAGRRNHEAQPTRGVVDPAARLCCAYWPNGISDLFGHNRVFVARSDARRARGYSGLTSTGVEAERRVFVPHQ